MAFVNGANYLALPRNAQKWLLEDIVPSSGTLSLSGQPKAGKSFCLLAIAEAIANPQRTHWNGIPVMEHGNVMIFQLDTPRNEWADRFDKLSDLGFDFSNVYVEDIQSYPHFPFDILDPVKLAYLQQQVALIKPALIIIDTIRDAHSGDENDSTVMRNVLLKLIAATLPATCWVVAHNKKVSQYMASGGDDLINDVRGSGAVVGKMDNVLALSRTRLSWKGRAGQGELCIKQDPPTGLILLDGDAAKELAEIRTVITRERTLDPKCSRSHIATEVCKALGWMDKNKNGQLKSHKTADRKVEALLKEK